MAGWLDNIKAAVSDEWNQFADTGAPALIAGVENYAAQQLSGMAKQNTQQATTAAQQIMAKPSSANQTGLGKSISDVFSNIAQVAGGRQYGPYIIAGVAGCVFLGMYLRGK